MHKKERERVRPVVEAGNAVCAQPECLHASRVIEPGRPWDLAHSDDRESILGPAHMDCNRLAALKKARAMAVKTRPEVAEALGWKPTREW
jgi:hypothetical protein